jgi:hypothetical protein
MIVDNIYFTGTFGAKPRGRDISSEKTITHDELKPLQ